MPEISKEFLIRLKVGTQPAYRIAQRAGVNPGTLSKLICGIQTPKPNDERIIRVGALLGLQPEDCFAPTRSGTTRG